MTTPQARLRLRQWSRTLATVFGDALIISAAYIGALVLRFEGAVPPEKITIFGLYLGPVVVLYLASNALFGIYRQLWRYASAQEVANIVLATSFPTFAILIVEIVFSEARPIPISVVIISWFLTTGWLTVSRYRTRLYTGLTARFQYLLGSSDRERVLIIGAGQAGQQVARHLMQPDVRHRYELVGYIDDDLAKVGRRVMGGLVLGARDDIARVAEERQVALIIIAIHRISGTAIREIITRCEDTDARLKVLNAVFDFDEPGRHIELRDIEPEDLMGREAVPLDLLACQKLVEGRRVLVTGAAGSIGSEMCRQLVAFGPERLVMLDANESGLYDLHHEIRRMVQANIAIVLADITDQQQVDRHFAHYKPDVVFHAAAYKHVPILETYPHEAIRVNVLGTRNVMEACMRFGVKQGVAISTDKAVEPTSIMGASKLMAERLVASLPGDSGTRFAVVRFGNVINSRGSVVPLFIRQIEQGGPITITHPDITRYFMSIPEAVSLVIQAATLSTGNDLFVLDMGEPIKIADLARKLVRMHGLRQEDLPIEFIGLRPGEKLTEALTTSDEKTTSTSSEKILRVVAKHQPDSAKVRADIAALIELVRQDDPEAVRQHLRELADMHLPDNLTTQPLPSSSPSTITAG